MNKGSRWFRIMNKKVRNLITLSDIVEIQNMFGIMKCSAVGRIIIQLGWDNSKKINLEVEKETFLLTTCFE